MVNNRILILFDIDGTLVLGARCHYQAFVEAVKKFYGMEDDISGINYAGKTDPQILGEVLALGGLNDDEIKQNFQVCLDFMADYYLKNVHYENVRSLEGVNDLLKELQRREVLLGLVTGNLESIAYAKLGKVDLDGYFPFGGFGSDHSNRSFLVRKALKHAQNRFGYKGKHVFVIGDTPRDVKAAKDSNLHTIGVATGRYSKEELENCGADYVLKDLKNIDEVLEILSSYNKR
jgi:phosphoglycolate phosphatase-like HAD superfamily hydrolase